MAGEDLEYCRWVKGRECAVSADTCLGVVEAHHAGWSRGLSQKAHDHTCVPLCTQHHRDWHAAAGPFKHMNKTQRRRWATLMILCYRGKWHDEQARMETIDMKGAF